MKSKDRIVLSKILDYVEQVNDALNMFGNDFDKFKSITVFSNACCMCILQIGELCKVLSDELKTQEKEIPWKSWCGIRDIFAHQYSNLDYQSAWDTICNDLPELQNSIQRILLKNDQDMFN